MNVTYLPEQQFLSKLKEIILSNLEKESFGVKDLAREAGVSSSMLRRRFIAFQKNRSASLLVKFDYTKLWNFYKKKS